jgi:hypothetical protein
MSDHRLTFAEMVDITQAAPLDTSDADAEQQSADQSWADYERITKENAEAKAQNTRRIVALGLGYSDWPDEVLDAAADDSGFAEALCRQANTQRARDALKERDEWKLNRKPLDIATLSELLARPETPWRIKSREKVNVPGTGDGLIPAESNTLVVGIAKIGKTTFLGNLMHSLITGEPFLGRYNEIRRVAGSVVVLNYEVSGRTYARWLDEMEVPNEHLHIISLRGAPNPFRSERAKAELVKSFKTETAKS